MPRLPRYVLPGHPQHVIQRGTNRCPIFIADEDYGCFRHHLREACDRHDCRIHAYVLMTTHVHLVKQVEFFRKPASESGARFLVATDAAGEGINLQVCHILFNYDIPWNPNRLEQRMGRIHRYGQKRPEVFILNLIAGKTREGKVVKILLDKLETIRKELFSEIRNASDIPDLAGVYRLPPARIEEAHKNVLFNGLVEACDGTVASVDTIPITITQISVCLVSYSGQQGSWTQRGSGAGQLRAGDDPSGQFEEFLIV